MPSRAYRLYRIFLRRAEICRQGPKEHFDTCRSFLHDGRIKVPKIHSWPLPYYTHRQINVYRLFFADLAVTSQPILIKFYKDYFRVTRRQPIIFYRKVLYS